MLLLVMLAILVASSLSVSSCDEFASSQLAAMLDLSKCEEARHRDKSPEHADAVPSSRNFLSRPATYRSTDKLHLHEDVESDADVNNANGLHAHMASTLLTHAYESLMPTRRLLLSDDLESDRRALMLLYKEIDDARLYLVNWSDQNDPCSFKFVDCADGRRVTSLDLTGQDLSGRIVGALGSLTGLISLSLVNNRLSGTIPAELGALSSLVHLNVSSNQLVGAVPPELGSLSSLQYLLTNGNQLSGTIPPELASLFSLNYLHLYDNKLSGTIPPGLRSLASLYELRMTNNLLSGTIPPELGSLSKLGNLQLYTNKLSGTIPPPLGSLRNLIRLQLQSNHLGGTIPPELGSLSSLQFLYMDENKLSGTVPPTLGSLSSLQFLYLYSNHLSGTIPLELGSLRSLSELRLDSNQLSGTIPPTLGSLSSLSNLQLYINQLSGTIPHTLGSLPSLSLLYLHQNQLVGPIPVQLGLMPSLLELVLSGNPWICGPTPAGIEVARDGTWSSSCPPCFDTAGDAQVDWGCTSVQPICVATTKCLAMRAPTLQLPPGKTCPDRATCQDLEQELLVNVLSLLSPAAFDACNRTWDVEESYCPRETAGTQNDTCTCYKGQIASLNGVSAKRGTQGGLDGFIALLSNCPAQYLDGCRPYTAWHRAGYEACNLRDEFEALLTRVGANPLTDCSCLDDCLPLPPPPAAAPPPPPVPITACRDSNVGVGQDDGCDAARPFCMDHACASNDTRALLALKSAVVDPGTALDSWNVSGDACETFAWVNCTGGRVTSLDLGGKRLAGNITSELVFLTALTALYLHNNQLSGTIPPVLGSLSRVTALYLNNNKLSGSIPPPLGSLPSLHFLYLNNNQLSGTIPSQRGSLSPIKTLYLHSNRLRGVVPPGLGSLPSLTQLSLYGNLLSGTIPPALGSLVNLKTLWVYNNQLSGTIPQQLGALSSLSHLHLYDNKLSGTIPPQLGSLHSLNKLYLHRNRLSGLIPADLGSLSSLWTLSVSYNRLSGTIPPQLGLYLFLQYMDLSSNQLFGTVPSELASLPTLLNLNVAYNPWICGPDPAGRQANRTGTRGPACPACFDTAPAPEPDWNCTPDQPVCADSAACIASAPPPPPSPPTPPWAPPPPAPPAPPAGSCSEARPLAFNGELIVFEVYTPDSRTEFPEGDCPNLSSLQARVAWHNISVSALAALRFETGVVADRNEAADTVIRLYTSQDGTCEARQCMQSNDEIGSPDSPPNLSRVDAILWPSRSYFLAVHEAMGALARFTLSILALEPPLPSSFEGSCSFANSLTFEGFPVTGTGYTYPDYITRFEDCMGQPSEVGRPGWFKLSSVPEPSALTFEVSSAAFNPAIRLYASQDETCNTLTCVGIAYGSGGDVGYSRLDVSIEPWTAYYLAVYEYESDTIKYLEFNLTIRGPPPPPSPPSPPPSPPAASCSAALPLAFEGEPVVVEAYTPEHATVLEGCLGYLSEPSRASWYMLNVSSPLVLIFEITSASFDPVVRLYVSQDNTCDMLTCMGMDDDSGAGRLSRLEASIVPLTSYFLAVYGFEGDAGLFKLSIRAACPKALPLKFRGEPVTVEARTPDRVTFIGGCQGHPSETARAAWYTFDVSSSVVLVFEIAPATFNSTMRLYASQDGTCDMLTCMGIAYGSGGDVGYSRLEASIVPLTSYFLAVYGFEGDAGLFKLSIREA